MNRKSDSERSSRATSSQPAPTNEYLEALIKMRDEDPRRYRLNTSVATRQTVEVYERQKTEAQAKAA